MRIADSILAEREQILVEWEAFARTCAPASSTMDVEALRDHAAQMLTTIAADLRTPQDQGEQSEKSKGRAPVEDPDDMTAAEEHGAGRAESGFTVQQMVAEYRALRASVLRMWMKQQGELEHADLEDLTRFNEAIDQSLAERGDLHVGEVHARDGCTRRAVPVAHQRNIEQRHEGAGDGRCSSGLHS